MVESESLVDWLRPFKVLISLLDKSEIGQPLISQLFKSILRATMRRSHHEVKWCRSIIV